MLAVPWDSGTLPPKAVPTLPPKGFDEEALLEPKVALPPPPNGLLPDEPPNVVDCLFPNKPLPVEPLPPNAEVLLVLEPNPPPPNPPPVVAVVLPNILPVEAAEPKAGLEAPKPELEVPNPVEFKVSYRSGIADNDESVMTPMKERMKCYIEGEHVGYRYRPSRITGAARH